MTGTTKILFTETYYILCCTLHLITVHVALNIIMHFAHALFLRVFIYRLASLVFGTLFSILCYTLDNTHRYSPFLKNTFVLKSPKVKFLTFIRCANGVGMSLR